MGGKLGRYVGSVLLGGGRVMLDCIWVSGELGLIQPFERLRDLEALGAGGSRTGGSRRPQEAPGGPRRIQKAPVQEAAGDSKRLQENTGGSRPQEAPGTPGSPQEAPGGHQEAPKEILNHKI